VHCDAADVATVEGLQTTDTEEIVGEGTGVLNSGDPPPQPMTTAGSKQAKRAYHRSFFNRLLLELHWRLLIKAHLPERTFSTMRGDLFSVSERVCVAMTESLADSLVVRCFQGTIR
jgi:hypothetical protein